MSSGLGIFLLQIQCLGQAFQRRTGLAVSNRGVTYTLGRHALFSQWRARWLMMPRFSRHMELPSHVRLLVPCTRPVGRGYTAWPAVTWCG